MWVEKWRHIGCRAALRWVLLAVSAACCAIAGDDLGRESPDGWFPDHGSCSYFGLLDGAGPILSVAEDIAATAKRTRETDRVLAMIPQPKFGGILPQKSRNVVARRVSAVACEGIDDCIQQAANAAGIPLAQPTTDAEFLRRVRLDLTGRIPSKDEVLSFLADHSADKRAELVDRLIGTKEWADRWAVFFGDLFRNTHKTAQFNRREEGRDAFHLYLVDSLRRHKPYALMAREILAAEGTIDGRVYPDRYNSFEHYEDVFKNYVDNPVQPSAAAYAGGGRMKGGPMSDTYDQLAFVTARDFLGISLMDCVLCHDGVGRLDSVSLWGTHAQRVEAWGLAAFFSDIPHWASWDDLKKPYPIIPRTGKVIRSTRYWTIWDLPQGVSRAVKGDAAGDYLAQTEGGNRPDRFHAQKIVEPTYPFESSATVSPGMRLREQLGAYLTADRQFARAAVNYIWREFFSRGIVEPADQFDLSRLDPGKPPPKGWDIQPSHPYLLEWLTDGFRESGFDLRWLMREITTSATYQLSSRYEGVFSLSSEKYFVRHQVKRLTAEQIYDALIDASGISTDYYVSKTFDSLKYSMQFPDLRLLPPILKRYEEPQRTKIQNVRMFLQAFTPGDRESTARSDELSPLQALNLMNNWVVLNKLRTDVPSGTLGTSLELADDALVTNLYLSVLGRHPTEQETAFAVDYLGTGDRAERAANLMWVMFNKPDFYFNY